MVRAAFLHPTNGGEDSGWWMEAFSSRSGVAAWAEPWSGELGGGLHIAAHPGTDGTRAPSGTRGVGGSFSTGSG